MKVSKKGTRLVALALCMLMVLAVAAPAMAASIAGYVTITAASATVYSDTTKATTLGTFAKGDVVAVEAGTSTMWKVRLSSSTTDTGYIEKSTASTAKSNTGGKATAAVKLAGGGSATGTTSETKGVIYNVSKDVNFREAANTTSKATKLNLGQEVTILGEEGDFYKVSANGKTGYVSKAYVKITSQATNENNSNSGAEAVAASGLVKSSTRAYKGADSKSGSAGTISSKAVVDITGQTGDYYLVTSGKITGYVLKTAITVLPTVSSATGTVTITAAAKFYEAPSTASKTTSSVPKGKTADVTGETSVFYRVTYNKKTGYIEKTKAQLESASNNAGNETESVSAKGIIKSSAKLYKTASKTAASNGTLSAKAIVDISGQTSDFYQVKSGTKTGFVLKTTVTVLPTETSSSGTATANASIKLYEVASTASKSLVSITKGKTMTVSAETSEFYKVTYSSKVGYVEKSKVTVAGASAPTTSTGGTGKVTLGKGDIKVTPSNATPSSTVQNGINAAKKINSDTIGYVNISGTNIQQPILYSSNGNVHYYANIDINKKKNTAGAVYSYYKSMARNNTINGHNMRGSNNMFHQLHHLQEKALGYSTCQTTDYKCKAASLSSMPNIKTTASARIWEINLFGYNKWEIFAMYEVPATEPKTTLANNINHLSNATPAQVKTWIEGQIKRSQIDFKTDVSTDDVFLTVYTCGTNYDYSTAQSRLYFFLKAVA
ncbi:SH3 domain-containing protein [Christensenellaceae bacterium OttesenSCG-928-M15]|nr:SH3 domain-containing protein [Christensenellaceae bacterium OttesenSCG-928-M15]